MTPRTSDSHPLRVDSVGANEFPGRLGITFAPDKKSASHHAADAWDRHLDVDLDALADRFQTHVLVSLMEDHKYDLLEIPELLREANERGMEVVHLPIRDVSVPRSDQREAFEAMHSDVSDHLRQGRNVVVHCHGGLGRSGLVAASVLTRFGASADEAIARVRAARPGAIETAEQERFVRDLGARGPGPTLRDRFRGALLGLAAGDALGTTLEFRAPGTFEPIADMVGGGPFGLEAGQWTDDTSMALCLAESLIECRDFDPRDQMERYVRWWQGGHLSSTDRCFDIGVTTRNPLQRFLETGEPDAGSTDPNTAGNSSIVRLAPVPMAAVHDPERAMRWAADSSRTTHGTRAAVDACRYFAGLLVGALHGEPKYVLPTPGYAPAPGAWDDASLHPRIDEIASGSFLRKEPPEIRGTGYVVDSLEAALWAFAKASDFEEGALLAVNLGDDADTTGAVYGQIAGAFYGAQGIPERWQAKLAMRERIEGFADALYEMSASTREPT